MKFTLVILFILTAGITFAQEDKILFESGYSLQYAHYDTALLEMLISQDSTNSNLANKIVNQLQLQAISKFDELITRFPNSTLYLNALYQKAEAEFSAGLNSEAKNTFLKVISLNQKKGKSLIKLAFISLSEREYQKALDYIKQRKEFQPQIFCGNDQQADDCQMAYIEKECKTALSKK